MLRAALVCCYRILVLRRRLGRPDRWLGRLGRRAPFPEPVLDNIGVRGGLSAIYLGNGVVLTANHVGAGDVSFGGTSTRTCREARSGSSTATEAIQIS